MFDFLTGNALWHLVAQSDAISKIVLLVLLVLSIISWALFFYELYILRIKKAQLQHALSALQNVNSVEELLAIAYRLNGTFPAFLLNKYIVMLQSMLETAKRNNRGLSAEERELLREYGYQLVDELMVTEEQNLPYFSATAAVSPLLGLFGTVWGLVHAFMSISEKQSADIATVAPGIAEALITTLAGLIVAIPALVMYVFLNARIKNIEHYCVQLTDRFTMIVHRMMHQ